MGGFNTRRPKPVRCHVLVVAASLVLPAMPPSTVVDAQATRDREAFDVASITENRNNPTPRPRFRPHPSGLTVTNATPLELIEYAFGVAERDVVGELPRWVRTAKFDVTAKGANGPLTRTRLLSMTKALLEDRFQLDASIERVVGPVYALAMARSDGTVGPRLVPSQSKCLLDPPQLAPLRADDDLPVRALALTKCSVSHMTDGSGLIGLLGSGATMQQLAGYLSRIHGFNGFDRPVVDRTGLNGEFDLQAFTTSDMVSPSSQANFLTAMREQLGLVLRAEQGPFDVLRIRRINQPSPN